MPKGGGGIERLTIFNLKDDVEQNDHVVHIYHKSLLYLVSGALEKKRKMPILGMESYLAEDDDIVDVIGKPVRTKSKSVVIRSKGGAKVTLASSSTSHGGFDNDPDTLNSMLRIIRGSNQLVMGYTS